VARISTGTLAERALGSSLLTLLSLAKASLLIAEIASANLKKHLQNSQKDLYFYYAE
jgi:hypothetical protein